MMLKYYSKAAIDHMILQNTNRDRYLSRRNYSVVPTVSFKSRLIRCGIAVIKSPLFYILIWCITIRAFYFSQLEPYSLSSDSHGYLNYPYNIFNGEVELYHTPGYSYFIKLIRKLVGENLLLYAIPLFQTVIALVAVVLFYFAAEKLFKSKRWTAVVTIYLGSLPQLMGWEKKILTESISISGTILLLAILVAYLDSPRNWLAFCSGLVCFTLIMVRPFSVIYLVILAVFWVARIILCRGEWKPCLIGICSVAVCFGLIQGYNLINFKANGYYGLSPMSICWNQGGILVENNFYPTTDYFEISQEILGLKDNSSEGLGQIFQRAVVKPKGENFAEKYVKKGISENLLKYVDYLKSKNRSLLNNSINTSYVKHKSGAYMSWNAAIMETMLPLTFVRCYVLIVIELLYAFVQWFKTKHVPWISFGLVAFPSAIFVGSIVGSFSEFQRLLVSAIPFLVLIIFIDLQRAVKLIRSR